jgi:replicative DNA helicase
LRDTEHDPRLNTFRQPPHNTEAEKALLGAIFANNRAYEKVSDYLLPEHFALPQNGLIFEACGLLRKAGKLADPVTMRAFFEGSETLADIGGAEYLMELAGSAVGVINAGEYGKVIYGEARKRDLIGIGEKMIDDAYSGDVELTAEAISENAEQELFGLGETPDGGPRPLSEILDTGLKHAEAAYKTGATVGVKTGLTELDRMTAGLFPGDLTVLAGATSMGKTTLAMTILRNAARNGTPGLGFSLEMPGEHLGMREVSGNTGLQMSAIRSGQFDEAGMRAMIESVNDLRGLPIWLDDRAALPMSAVHSTARRYIRDKKIGLIVVDYLQLIKPDTRYRGQRVQEVSEIARGLKNMAKTLAVPVVALSQLKRLGERKDNRPHMDDLRESGEIEQAADLIMFAYRHHYYLEKNPPIRRDNEKGLAFNEREIDYEAELARCRNRAELIVAKQRNGPTGTITLHFDPEHWRFGNAQIEQQDDLI